MVAAIFKLWKLGLLGIGFNNKTALLVAKAMLVCQKETTVEN
jgi:hypothetical protein